MTKYNATIIIPTRKRAKLLAERLKVIRAHTKELYNGDAELIIAYDEDDKETRDMISRRPWIDSTVVCKSLETPANKWNQAAKISKGEWLVTISDDCIPQVDWLTNALSMASNGFIGLPDGVTGDRNNFFTPLYMATKDWLRRYHGGVLVIPWYQSWFADIETAMRAKRAGHYMIGPNSVVTQLHAIFNTADNDEIYRIGESRRAEDNRIYNLRASRGFPDDFARVL